MEQNEAYVLALKVDTSRNDAYGAFTVDLKGNKAYYIIQLIDMRNSSTDKLENEAYIQVSKIDTSKNDAYGAFTTDHEENEAYYSSVRQV